MTDSELLELAAKAAGIAIAASGPRATGFDDHSCATREDWNPLTDDGDALRLSVKLGLDVAQDPENTMVAVFSSEHEGTTAAVERYDADPYAATFENGEQELHFANTSSGETQEPLFIAQPLTDSTRMKEAGSGNANLVCFMQLEIADLRAEIEELKAQQAQTMEPVAYLWKNCSGGYETIHKSQKGSLNVIAVFTHPAPPPIGEPTVKQPLSTEREELIADHQELNMGNYSAIEVEELNNWANWAHEMLEADANIATNLAQVTAHRDHCLTVVDKLKAQQVAVPAGCLVFTEQDMIEHLKPSAIKTIKAADLAIRYAKRKAPRPPQGDKP